MQCFSVEQACCIPILIEWTYFFFLSLLLHFFSSLSKFFFHFRDSTRDTSIHSSVWNKPAFYLDCNRLLTVCSDSTSSRSISCSLETKRNEGACRGWGRRLTWSILRFWRVNHPWRRSEHFYRERRILVKGSFECCHWLGFEKFAVFFDEIRHFSRHAYSNERQEDEIHIDEQWNS